MSDDAQMMSEDKIRSHLQNAAVESFAGAVSRREYLLSKVASLFSGKPPRALNIRTGRGYLEEGVVSRGWESYSLDPNWAAVERLLARGIHGKVGRIENLPFDALFFGVVVVSEVLEHLTDDQLSRGIAEVARVLKEGGVIVGTVPYREVLSNEQVVCPHCGAIFRRWGHQRSLDEQSVSEWLSGRFKTKLLAARYLCPWKNLNWKGKASSLAKLFLTRVGIHGSGEHVVFVGQKPWSWLVSSHR